MSAMIGFKNIISDSNYSPALSLFASTAAHADHPLSFVNDGRVDNYFESLPITAASIRMTANLNSNTGIAIVGAVGVEAISGSGVSQPLMVRFKVGTTAGGVEIGDFYRRVVPSTSPFGISVPANAFIVLPFTHDDIAKAIGGLFTATNTISVDVILFSTGLCRFRVREAGAWSALIATMEASRSFGCDDKSDSEEAFVGAEYFFERSKKRTIQATLNNLYERNVFGGAFGNIPIAGPYGQVSASVSSVNKYAGKSKPVVFIPDSDIPASPYVTHFDSSGRNWDIDNRAQSELMYGYLPECLTATEFAHIDSKISMWKTQVRLTEAFNGIS